MQTISRSRRLIPVFHIPVFHIPVFHIPVFHIPVFAVLLLALGLAPVHAQTPPLGFVPTGPATVIGTIPPPAGSAPAFRPVFLATSFGVKADGRTDDRASIQAALDAAVAVRGGIVQLPAGNIKIKGHLVLHDETAQIISGIILQGAGPGAQGDPRLGGTTIQLTTLGQHDVLEIGNGRFYQSEFRDFTVMGAGDTAIGVDWANTNWTDWLCQNIYVYAVNTAFQKDYSGGNANGEASQFLNCRAGYVHCLWRNTTGQGYSDLWIGGEASYGDGGCTAFDYPGTGYMASVYNVSMTFSFRNPLNRVVSLGGVVASFTIQGCRIEGGPTLVHVGSGTPNANGHFTARDNHITNLDGGEPLINGGGTNSQWFITLDHNLFDSHTLAYNLAAGQSAVDLGIALGGGDLSHIAATGNTFRGFGSVNLGPAPLPGIYHGTVLTDNWMDTGATRVLQPLTN